MIPTRFLISPRQNARVSPMGRFFLCSFQNRKFLRLDMESVSVSLFESTSFTALPPRDLLHCLKLTVKAPLFSLVL
jgi:hypothetical protein